MILYDFMKFEPIMFLSRPPTVFLLITGALITGSHFNPKLQFGVRAIISLFFVLIFSAYGSIVAILFTIIGKRALINWATARSYAYIAGSAVGISYKVEGEEYLNTGRPAIYICNHQAAVDLFVLGRVFPKNCVVVGKAELKYVPLLNIFMILGRAIFLDRKNRVSAIHELKKAAEDIKERKASAFIFPEGTRSRSQEAELLPFKKGAFHLAVQAEIPIIPVVAANYSDIYDSKRRIFRGGELFIKALPPIEVTNIDVDNKDQIDMLTNKTREVMLNTLQEITLRKNASHIGNGNTKIAHS